MEEDGAAAQSSIATTNEVDADEHVEMQINNNQAASAAAVHATSLYTDVAPNTEEAEKGEKENGFYDAERKAKIINTHDEEQQQQQQPPQSTPSSPAATTTTTPQHAAATGVVPPPLLLTRVYLAGIPPAKPYRRITYTEWSPSTSESMTMIPDYQDVEKKVKTTKCLITSCLLSLAFYTVCFLIIPIFLYICYVIFYVIYQSTDEDEPTDDTLPNPQAEVEDSIPCPYALAQRDECP